MNGDAGEARMKRAEREGGLLVGKKPAASDGFAAASYDMEELKRWDGKDIVRRGGARKSRYLLAIPACLNTTPGGGKLGLITKMDTERPVLYIDFAQGRLKCTGRVVHPTSRFLPLSFESKEVVCKDIITSMLVFSQVEWVGTLEDNPEEKTLPLPKDLFEGSEVSTTTVAEAFKHVEKKKEGGGRGKKRGSPEAQEAATPRASSSSSGIKRPRRSSAPTKVIVDIGTSEEEDLGEDEEDEEEEEEEQEMEEENQEEEEEEAEVKVIARPSRGSSTKKRRKVVLDDDDDDEEEEEEDGGDDESVEVDRKAKGDSRGHLRRQSAGAAKYTFDDEEDDEEEEEGGSEAEEEEEEGDEEEDDDDDQESDYDGND